LPRNGSGSYNPPLSSWNPAIANQTISSDDWNSLRDDMSTAISQSLANDGQTTASARIPFAQGISVASGTVTTPAVNFSSDPDCGLYRVGANEIGLAAGGVAGLTVTSTGVTAPLNLTVNGNTTIGSASDDTLTVNATTTFVGPVTVPNDTITNAKLANVATSTFKGRITAGTGDPEDLTTAQATSLLDAVVGATQSTAGTKGAVPAPAATQQDLPLCGSGTYKRGIGRFAGGRLVSSGSAVTGGLNIASATWSGSGPYQIAVVFTNPAQNTNYQVMELQERNGAVPSTDANNCCIIDTSKTVNGFTLEFNAAAVAVHISVFEG
jgi:hypothetical protein